MHLTRRRLLSLAPWTPLAFGLGTLPGSRPPREAPPLPRPPRGGDEAAFLRAVVAGDLGEVRRGLARDPALAAATDADGCSAVALAFLHGRDEVGGVLVAACRAAGRDLDVVESVLARDWPRFDALVAAGADVDAPHPAWGPPLWTAALAGANGLWRLRSAGCDPEQRGAAGTTPARAAMTCRTLTGARVAATDLLANGADANAVQPDGDSVLHGAVRRRSADLVRLAVRKGADPAARDRDGRTPRDLAVALEWAEGAALLERHAELPRDHRASRFLFDRDRAEVARPDLSDVPRALQCEVTGSSHMRLQRVRELVGADPRLTFSMSADDELAIEASAHTGNAPIMRLHLECGAPLSLPTAVSLGDAATVRFLLERDPLLVHERGAHDFPVMFYTAFGTGSVELAELLRGLGVGVDQESMGTTTLHWCVKRDRVDLARWLLDHGADPEALAFSWDPRGQTPRELAAAEGSAAMKELLDG
ncbi:MAG: ankyrin repeat domain-containing protein [Planctomycetota bacterium]